MNQPTKRTLLARKKRAAELLEQLVKGEMFPVNDYNDKSLAMQQLISQGMVTVQNRTIEIPCYVPSFGVEYK